MQERTKQTLWLTAGALATGVVGYAIWFDYKRQNDKDFRRKLDKDRKRTSRDAKKAHKQKQKADEEAIDAVVRDCQRPGVLPTNPAAMEQ